MDMEFDKGLGSQIGDSKMNQSQTGQDDLLDTTDCLEAIGVFRGWKNFLFVIVLGCLLIQQALFWAVNIGWVGTTAKAETPANQLLPVAMDEPTGSTDTLGLPPAPRIELPQDMNEITRAAELVTGDPNLATAEKGPKKTKFLRALDFEYVAWLIRILNFVLIIAATLYCLTMLFSLKVSLLGRLGGINHICRAFFLSLVFLVLLLPWQQFFGPVVKGEIFTADELLKLTNWYEGCHDGLFVGVLYYLRFTGYWLLVMLVLFSSFFRSSRWSQATLRRLEII